MRTEKVRLILEDDFSAKMARAAAAAKLFGGSLDDLDGTQVSASKSTRALSNDVDTSSTSFRRGESSLNQFTGRLTAMAQAAAIVGPAIAPIGAVAVPALTGLASAGGLAVAALGTLVASTQGVGDALKAVDEYQLEPTAANLEKAQAAMAKLGPDARGLVGALDQMQPVLRELRDAGAAGWVPGLVEALEQARKLAPDVAAFMEATGRAGGSALASGVESLASPRWQEFREFLTAEAPSAVHDLAAIVGDLAHGASEMWMSFQPGNRDFLNWLRDVADGFDSWASSDEGRESIEGFLTYLRDNGPKVQDFFVSTVSAVSELVQAAAPLGGPTLQVLTAVADVMGAIAASDAGTPLLGMAAALSVYNRALRATEALQRSTFGQAAGGSLVAGGGIGGMLGRQTGSIRSAARLVSTDLGTIGAAWATAGARTQREAARMSAATRSLRTNLGGLARATAPFAAGGATAAIIGTGIADEMGLTSTATLGLTGALVGGAKGGIAGGLVGAIADIAAANNDWEETQRALNRGMGESLDSLNAYLSQVDSAREKARDQARSETDFSDSIGGLFTDPAAQLRTTFANYGTLFGGQTLGEQMQEDATKAEDAGQRTLRALGEIAFGLGDRGVFKGFGGMDVLTPEIDKLAPSLERMLPYLDQLGISFDDLSKMDAGQISVVVDQVRGLAAESESSAGRMKALGDAVLGLDNDLLSTSDSADALVNSLDALLLPGLNLSQATDEWRNSLRDLNENLAENRTLTARNDAGDQNRAAIRDQVVGLKNLLEMQARNGAGSDQLAKSFDRQAGALMRTGVAAGLNRRELRNYLTELGFTPKVVSTTLRQIGVTAAQNEARNLRAAYDSLPPRIQTQLRQLGADATKADVNALLARYELTEKQRTALIKLRDNASGPAAAISRALDAAARSRTATITVVTHRTTTGRADIPLPGRPSAEGSTVPKSGLPYADRYPYLLADGEEVISNRFGQADRFRPLLKAINANRLAGGGTAGGDRGDRDRDGRGETRARIRELRESLREVSKELRGVSKRLEENRETLREMRQYRSEVGSSLAGDLTGNGLAGFDLGLRANRNDARAAARALLAARRKGLDGPLFDFIAASGDLNLIQQFAALSERQIRQRERAFAGANIAQRNLGDLAVAAKFGRSVDGLADVVRQQARRERNLEKRQKTIERGIEKATERGSRKGTREGNRDRNRGNGPRRRNRR